MALTELTIRNAKAEKPYRRISDGGGLYLEVRPSGTKTWFLTYRDDRRRQKKVRGGRYPDMRLAEAREWREQVKGQIRKGLDPAREKHAAKVEAGGDTLETVGREWFERQRSRWKDTHAPAILRRLEADVFPLIGDVLIGKVTHADVLRVAHRIEKRGAHEMVRKVLQHIGGIMRFAIATQRAERNPVPDLHDALKPKPKTRNLAKMPTARMPKFYGKLATSKHDKVTKLALQWTILTWARTSETRYFRPEEIEGRGTDALLWRVAPERMKMGREHLIPLPRQAGPLLEEIEFYARREESPWQFPQVRNAKKPIDENVMLYCLHDLGFKGVATVHGFRGVASTLINEQVKADGTRRFDKDWVEMQLAHSEEDEVRSAYNAAEYLLPRRAMLQWWADWLEDQQAMAALL